MKKMILMVCMALVAAAVAGCAWTPEQTAKFQTVIEQAAVVGVPQAQELVDRNVAEGNLTQKQGDFIMKLVTAYAEKMKDGARQPAAEE